MFTQTNSRVLAIDMPMAHAGLRRVLGVPDGSARWHLGARSRNRGYLLLLALMSRTTLPPVCSSREVRFVVVVPAHNEERGIARTVDNLLGLDWPRDRFRALVVADNCRDATAARAAEAGAEVLVRIDPDRRGKGYALERAFEQVLSAGGADAVVVIDADTIASPNLLSAFAARLELGALAVQAEYAVLNPDASWRTRLMTLAFALFHDVRSRGRERLRLSCGLRGNGMCFASEALRRVPHRAFSLVEDIEYGIRLGLEGIRSTTQPRRASAVRWSRPGTVRPRSGSAGKEDAWRCCERTRFPCCAESCRPRIGCSSIWHWTCSSCPYRGSRFSCRWEPWQPPCWPRRAWLRRGCSPLALGRRLRARLRWPRPLDIRLGARSVATLLWAPVYVAWKLALLFRRRRVDRGSSIRTAREGEAPANDEPRAGPPSAKAL